ncbi:MAG: hydroxymethylbilane synthase [Gammaproteobacteria bacterium]|nr:hydroxymethylbilane synthase [Gammaproteobacteria bacterium]|tara:strand:+ start:4624 stop:5538 length:915 start_codon:yes stop_codon:yes gene_type:complete
MKKIIKIATRQSPLAIKQAEIVREIILNHFNEIEVILVPMVSSGDNIDSKIFKSNGGKGLFIKELEDSLLKKETDLAVHSMKDVPARLLNNFSILTIMERVDPRDVFLSNKFKSLDQMAESSIVGTSSPRRIALLKSINKNIQIEELRGNIQTRIDKLNGGKVDAIILAAAGLMRLSLQDKIKQNLPLNTFIPSAGQGVLCVEFLKKNHNIKKMLLECVNKNVEICVNIERMFVKKINGDCMSPIGVHAQIEDKEVIVEAIVSNLKGSKFIKSKIIGLKKDSIEIANKFANFFIKQGARKLIKH